MPLVFILLKGKIHMAQLNSKQFSQVMNKLKVQWNALDEIDSLASKYAMSLEFVSLTQFDAICNCLEIMFDDYEDRWINYWMFDLDFGQKAEEYNVIMDGKRIDLRTPENLYNMITGNPDFLEEDNNDSNKQME